MITVAAVAAALARVRGRIASAGGSPGLTVVAVTKGFGADAMRAALGAGLTDIGENYAQELLPKLTELTELTGQSEQSGRTEQSEPGVTVPRLHFIGRLQTNKVRLLAPVVDVWQTVDRLALGTEVAKRAPGATVLVQVNVSDEPQKGGCDPGEVVGLVGRLQDLGLHVDGLMTVGATGPPEEARAGFRLLRRLADDLGLATCSMGMTDDLEVAVEEGSTMVRVGSALFGMRPVARARAH